MPGKNEGNSLTAGADFNSQLVQRSFFKSKAQKLLAAAIRASETYTKAKEATEQEPKGFAISVTKSKGTT
jgi:hypothetical protein